MEILIDNHVICEMVGLYYDKPIIQNQIKGEKMQFNIIEIVNNYCNSFDLYKPRYTCKYMITTNTIGFTTMENFYICDLLDNKHIYNKNDGLMNPQHIYNNESEDKIRHLLIENLSFLLKTKKLYLDKKNEHETIDMLYKKIIYLQHKYDELQEQITDIIEGPYGRIYFESLENFENLKHKN
jgi:hypothetical protein